jgi:transposase
MKEDKKCPRCFSANFIKHGTSFNSRKGVWNQRYLCNECGYKFRGKKEYDTEPITFVYQDKPVPPQNWTAYTQAQNQHKKGLMDITTEMLDLIEIKTTKAAGRPNARLKDLCFSLLLKTFTRLSARRLHSELEIAKQLGYIQHVPHFTILMKYQNAPEMTLLLKEMLKLSSLPIKEASSKTFSVDSTGFSTSQFGRWFDHKWGKETVRREWIKCHAMIENTSNIVVNATITEGNAADSPRFEKLVTETSKRFEIAEVAADKAYSSRRNLEIVSNIGAQALIPFKSNTTGASRGSLLWKRTYEFFKNHPQAFLERYHKRSNVESSFAMIKTKFGASICSKTFQGQKNKVLLKLICHNISCLLHEFYENKIEEYIPTQTPKIVIRVK